MRAKVIFSLFLDPRDSLMLSYICNIPVDFTGSKGLLPLIINDGFIG